MTRQTRFAMLVGLLFIVLFGIVLTELTGREAETAVEDVESPRGGVVHLVPVVPRRGPAGPAVAGRPSVPGRRPGEGVRRIEHPDRLVEVSIAPPGEGTVRHRSAAIEIRPEPLETPIRETPVPVDEIPVAAARAPVGRRVHKVAKGESLYALAERYYGDGSQYRRIVEANPEAIRDPSNIRVGAELVIPGTEAAAAVAAGDARRTGGGLAGTVPTPRGDSPRYVEVTPADLAETLRTLVRPARRPEDAGGVAPDRVYVVRRGDTLTRIAREQLRDDSPEAVRRIFEANQDRLESPDDVPAGVELVIPSAGAAG